MKNKIITNTLFIIIMLIFIYLGILIYNYQTYNPFEKLSYAAIWLILFVPVLLMFINILKSKNIVVNKKYNIVNEIDFFEKEIANIKGYNKIIKSDNGLILINESGIFEIRFVYFKGTLRGDLFSSKWIIGRNIINNPFLIKEDAYNYLVLTKNLLCQVTNIRLISKSKIIFVLDNMTKLKKYSKEEVEQKYEEIRSIYGSNEN